MNPADLQARCELGQQLLMKTEYLQAERVLAGAERDAYATGDYDTLARLYMPLQETRRQKRQRCAEGVVNLSLWAQGATDNLDPRRVIENYPHGQLLVAGWGSFQPALEVRRLADENDLYVETFLGAVYPVNDRRAVVIVPLDDAHLPDPSPRTIDALLKLLPAHAIVLHEDELPQGPQRPGEGVGVSRVAELWERLHQPFLSQASAAPEPALRIAGYRKTIRVDDACELAHQNLSIEARRLARA